MLKIIIAGDFFLQNRCKEKALLKDYSFFYSIRKLFSNADYIILNLEGPVVKGKYSPISKIGPSLCMSEEAIDVLKELNVSHVSLANNHIMDYSEEGLNSTMEYLNKAKIGYFGAGPSISEAMKPLILNKDNLRVGVVNCCEHEFSIVSKYKAGACPLDVLSLYTTIRDLKKKVNYVIVIVHGGHENFKLPSLQMQDTYRFLIDVGADIVINHHQHCISGVEEYKGKKIFYGIGNFCFDYGSKRGSSWYEGLLVELNLDVNSINSSYIPYIWENNPFRLEIKSPEHRINDEITFLSNIISNRDQLENEIDNYYSANCKSRLLQFEPYEGRITKKLFKLGFLPSFLTRKKITKILNSIECESHLQMTLAALKTYLNK